MFPNVNMEDYISQHQERNEDMLNFCTLMPDLKQLKEHTTLLISYSIYLSILAVERYYKFLIYKKLTHDPIHK